jgi:2-oxoglutarate dehydrogenase E2 component (dihydrolipoamide succinyltransferase)
MATELKVPTLGESITEAVIGKWLKNIGDSVAIDEPIVDLETDKVSVQLPAPLAGVLKEQKYPQGATVKVGDVIGSIDQAAATAATKPAASKPAEAPVKNGAGNGAGNGKPAPVAAAPAPQIVAVPAAVHEDIAVTAGLTPSERKALRENGGLPVAPPVSSRPPSAPPRVNAPAAGLEEVVPMSPLRKRIAERLVQAQHTAAILTTFNEVDMSAVMALRARHQEPFVAKYGIKLGFMSFFAKAAVEALKSFPGLNAEVRGGAPRGGAEGGERSERSEPANTSVVIYKRFYDIGVAVGGGKGLVVPVLRGVDKMSFADIEQGIATLAGKAKNSTLTLEDLSGGTFTISNGGIYGSMMSTPLLNMPQTGILGLHNIVKRAMVVSDGAGNDKLEIKPMMYIALSYDHRVVDGREAVQFLIAVKHRIENPDSLLFGL